ncbi:glycosyltransferase [Xanthomonas sp. CFBP 8703]|uniref:Glycosyltransferase n=1 Tax=Xanthomonas bonasiae TaxID=2810351 RepID=A0ABS3B496_9XANT|nr:glycosyltransferase [Xanthomonas bonasiae]MBN6103326.1 glycosyltransferase [Xanthomonas bonasiae]
MKPLYVLLAASAVTIALAGCGQDASQTTPATAPAPAPDAAAAAQAPVTKLTADQVSVKLSLESEPKVDTAAGVITFTVKVENNGKVALSGTSNPPVNLGVQIEGPGGNADGLVRDFARTPLPEIAPGASASVAVQVPADPRIDGRRLKVDLVQESVSWFADFGQPTLDVGPIPLAK